MIGAEIGFSSPPAEALSRILFTVHCSLFTDHGEANGGYGWGRPAAPFFLGGALFYLVGTFLVTGLGNVPLNDQLAAVSATDPGAREVWENFLGRWTMLNHARTAAAMAAALLSSLGLMQHGARDIEIDVS